MTATPKAAKPTAHYQFRFDCNIGQVYEYDSADDGPEVETIRFFARFPQGAIKGLSYWWRFVHAVNPNASLFS